MKIHRSLLWLVSGLASLSLTQAADDPGPGDASTIIINELSAEANASVVDDDGEAVDWIEIHNRGTASQSLAGWHLSDDSALLTKWAFPDLDLAPGAFLIVYASGKDRVDVSTPLHTNFKLEEGGEYLALTQADGSVSHDFDPEYPTQRQGLSYGLLESGGFRYLETQSPGEANGTKGVCYVADTKFSVNRGYYDAPFEVEITCATADAIIRYTTDGNEPSAGTLFGGATGEIYQGPITIDKTTVLRAHATLKGWQASNVDTQTYLFLEDVLRQSPEGEVPPGWPEGPVNGQRFDFGMDPEVVDDPEYADQILPALRSLPSMSLVMDQDDLTGKKDGIYVHARDDGRVWERPGSLELLNQGDEPGFQINAGVRIRGGFSRDSNNPKHSFRVFFREEYGRGTLKYPLFDDEGVDAFKKFDFRTAQNYAWSLSSSNDARRNTFLREIFARDSQRALGQPYTRSRYYHMYLNGQYWGLYMSQERAGADYAESYFGGKSEQYDVIKVEAGPYTVYATSGMIDAFDELHGLVSGELTDADFYTLQGKNAQGEDDLSLTKHIDVDNLIEYMMIIFYVGSFDAPLAGSDRANNFYAVRNRETRDGWRFFSHDTEHSMMNAREDRMGPYPAGRSKQHFNPQYLHQQLMQSDAYRLAFADHVRREFFGDGVFTVDASRERWMARQEEIQLAIIAESARWGDQHVNIPYTKETWLREADWILDTFMSGRTDTVFKQLEGEGLTGDLITPEFKPDGGVIEDPDSFKFKFVVGTLFNTQPGDLYYTLDGSDPKLANGTVSEAAILYDRKGPGAVLSTTANVRARIVHEGQWSPINEATFIGGGALATAETLVISEIMYHPPAPAGDSAIQDDEDAFEFIELWNPSDATVDLTGAWFEKGIDFTIPAFQLGPDERVVLVHNQAAFEERYGTGVRVIGAFGGEQGSKLSNNGERILLRNINDSVVVDFRYEDNGDWPQSADGAGSSIVLADASADLNDAASWQASGKTLGSPGEGSVVTPTLGYVQWKDINGIEDDQADTDFDGLTPFVEFATGNDPFVSSGHPISVKRADDDALIIGLVQNPTAPILAQLEVSSDLIVWLPLTGIELVATETISASQERQQWRVEVDGNAKAFRVRYSQ